MILINIIGIFHFYLIIISILELIGENCINIEIDSITKDLNNTFCIINV